MTHPTRILLILTLALASVSANSQQPTAAGAAKTGAAKPTSATSASTTLPSEATVNEFLKQMFGWNKDLTWKVAEIKPSEAAGISEATVIFNTPKGQEAFTLYVTADHKHAFTSEIIPFGADPFAPMRAELKDANGPSRGPKDAKLTIVEFGDLQCPACKQAQPNIGKLMEDEPKARLVFENFPLASHNWAMTAAKYVDCLGRNNSDAVWKFIGLVYDHQVEVNQDNVETMLKGYVKEAGAQPEAVAACAAKPETEKRVHESMALGEKLGVTSTPTFFINGRKLVGFSSNVPYDVVKQMADFYATEGAK